MSKRKKYTLAERSERPVRIVAHKNHYYVEEMHGPNDRNPVATAHRLTRKPMMHDECENWCVFKGYRNIGWNNWRSFILHGFLGKTIPFSRISTLAMTAGGEKKLKRVILQGRLKHWVGIGWHDLRQATESDRKTYKTVVED